VAGLAFGGTYFGAKTANDGAAANQQRMIDEERAKVDRDRRAATYIDFLDKANDYAYTVAAVAVCSQKVIDARPPGDTAPVTFGPSCSAELSSIQSKRHDFQGARNKVFYYGSAEAESAAQELASALPPAVGGRVEDPIDVRVDLDRFGRLYSEFNRVVCRDVQTDPRRTCG
jgi:hypothetical protein